MLTLDPADGDARRDADPAQNDELRPRQASTCCTYPQVLSPFSGDCSPSTMSVNPHRRGACNTQTKRPCMSLHMPRSADRLR